MTSLAVFSFFLLCITQARSAALLGSTPGDYDFHFNQLGVSLGFKMEDKSLPLKGGKIYAEFPISSIFSLIEGEPTLFKKLFVPFKEELYMFYNPGMLERLRDVVRMKALITYNAEHYKAGIFDAKIDYTFIHPDFTEEVGVVHAEGQDGGSVALEVTSKNQLVLPKFVLHPFKLETSFRPNSEFKVIYSSTHSSLETTFSKEGQTFKLNIIHKHPENKHKYGIEINVADKVIVLSHIEDDIEKTHLEFMIHGNIMNLEKVQMKGKLQETRWWEAGSVESTFLASGNDYNLNIMFKNKEIMKTKMNIKNKVLKGKMNLDFIDQYKGTIYFDYDSTKNMYHVKFPKEWFYDQQSFGVTINVSPIGASRSFLGGIYTATLLREDIPFFQFDIDYNFIVDSGKYELVFNQVKVESLNPDLANLFFYILPITKYEFCHHYLTNGCFQKGEFMGSIFFDRVNKNSIFNKFKVTGTVKKMETDVFNVIVDTVSSPYHISLYYPRLLQRTFNKPMERLTLDIDHQASGSDQSLTLTTSFEDMVAIIEKKSHQVSVKILKNDVTYVEFSQDFMLNDQSNTFLLTLKPKILFHTDSYIHKELCQFSSYFCFTKLVGDINIAVTNKFNRKGDMKIIINKDDVDIYHLEVNNNKTPYNFMFKSPYVVPFFKYMRGYNWFSWMLPVIKSPFDVSLEFHPVTKSLKIDTNIDTHENMIHVKPVGGDKFNIEFNHEVVAEFVTADRKVELMKTLNDRTQLKTIVSWTGNNILENKATVSVIYKNIPQVGTFRWNLKDLARGSVMLDVVGKKAPFLGDFEFHRDINWLVKNSRELELFWAGKAETNMMKTLATPVITDAKIVFKNGGINMKINKEFNAKKFVLLFNTSPFKVAFLPFFEI